MSEKKTNRAVIEVDEQLLNDITDLIEKKSIVLLQNILAEIYPADIALILNNLEEKNAFELFNILPKDTGSEVILELDDTLRDKVLESMPPAEISALVGEMDSNDATDIISELHDNVAENVLRLMETEDSSEVEELLSYDENTAGGLMAKEYVAVNTTDSIEEAAEKIRQSTNIDHLYHIWVVDIEHRLTGIVPIINIIISQKTPGVVITDIMNTEVISCDVNTDQEEVAKLFQKYDLVSLPVTDIQKRLVGRITIDDIVDVLEEEFSEDVAKIVGSDAEELESKSPYQIALLRLPWVLITLGIELLAGVVIHFYDSTLSKVILLASFMPIISAISGNTGLQSAAITVRALATGHASLSRWWVPVKRSFQTSLIIGAVCGLAIGVIAGIWYNLLLFGLLVGFSMFISINISGLVGASVPMLSKKLGFDPALTAGPFETAFQDVVGITIFLSLATLLIKVLI